MKKTVFLLKNSSYSIGKYEIDGVEFTLTPQSLIRVDSEPTSKTANIIVSSFIEDVPELKKVTKEKGEQE